MFHANSWGIAFGAPLTGARLVLPGAWAGGGPAGCRRGRARTRVRACVRPHTPSKACRAATPGPFLDGPSVYALLEEQRVTHTAGVPTVWLGLMQHMEQARGARLSTLRLMIVGGAACPR